MLRILVYVIENRLSNSKLHYGIHFWSLILVSIFFAWGLLKVFSKSFFVAVIVAYAHSYLEFVGVGGYILSVFVYRSSITDFAKTGQVSDDTINLINY